MEEEWLLFKNALNQMEDNPKVSEIEVVVERTEGCEICGSREYNGTTCTSCGLVTDSYPLSSAAEWTSCVTEDGRRNNKGDRVGPPPNLLYSDKWAVCTRMKGNTRLSRLHVQMNSSPKDRALYQNYKQLDNIGKSLGIQENVIFDAKVIYKSFASTCVITRGAPRRGLKAACLYMACQKNHIYKSMDTLINAFNITMKNYTEGMATLKRDLPPHLTPSVEVFTTPSDVVPSMMKNIYGVSQIHVNECQYICQLVQDCQDLQGRTPKGIAVAVIYLYFGGIVTKKEIVAACIVSNQAVSLPTLMKNLVIVKKEMEKNIELW